MNPAKKAAIAAKTFVTEHKLPIAIVTTAATTAVVTKKVFGNLYDAAEEFITEKGLREEFLEHLSNTKDNV